MNPDSNVFSIVVPVYQNRDNVEHTAEQLLALNQDLPQLRIEVVFVDDGSTDGSRESLRSLHARNGGRIRVVYLTRNYGQNAAIQAGLRHARGAAVGVISCDLQEPHRKFIEMIALWHSGHKFVIGERVERNEGWWHRQVSSIYWRLIRRYAFRDYPTMGYDFCLLDRQVVDAVNQINEKNSAIFVLIYWLGYKPARVPITREVRTSGRSQWGLRRKLTFTLDTLIGFTHAPARLITCVGLGVAALSGIYLLFVLYRWATTNTAPLGWMTVVGLVTLLGSLNLFAIGILSEYLLRILDESRKRPAYVVDSVLDGNDRPATG